jgi:lipopolysaccharide biosynthesis glycosyltransferase
MTVVDRTSGPLRITYFTLVDANYFLGAAAMINSLSLTGNSGRIVVVDTGLDEWQRERLDAAGVALIPLQAPAGLPATFYKPYMGSMIEGEVVVYVDSDIVLTDSLDSVVSLAASGRICAAPDGQPQRFFSEWADLMPLEQPLRREAYVNAGLLAVAPGRWPRFFERWQELCSAILELAPPMHTVSFEDALAAPVAWHDQDALNAMLMSELTADGVALIEPQRVVASADMAGVVCVDPTSLECRFAGTRLLFLHYLNGPKPWQPSGWITTSNNAYVQLLARLLGADDVPVKVDERELPPWLSSTGLRRSVLFAGIRGVRAASHAVPRGIRSRVRSAVSRR